MFGLGVLVGVIGLGLLGLLLVYLDSKKKGISFRKALGLDNKKKTYRGIKQSYKRK